MIKYKSANPTTRCMVCGGKFSPSRIAGLLECEECKSTTADLSIPEEDLRQLYTGRYFAGEEYRDYVADRPVIEKQFRLRLRKLLKYVQRPEEKNMFEIGCAYGFFLSVAKGLFRSVEGVDLSIEATTYASRVLMVEARSEDFLGYRFKIPPDVVCMWDTVEHGIRLNIWTARISTLKKRPKPCDGVVSWRLQPATSAVSWL